MNPLPGRGTFYYGGSRWFGRGGGRGARNMYYMTGLPGRARSPYGYPAFGGKSVSYAPEVPSDAEKNMLEKQADFLGQQLVEIKQRISALEKPDKKKE
jgi:hypothetical protein